ncbi:MAG: hypothetical protein ACRDHZ_17455, partial [Ktedonobacteraceae bacterium]
VYMRLKKRSTGFILKTLGILALLTAVSGLSALSFAPYPNGLSHSARLVIDTPGAASTDTPGAATTDTPGAASTDTPGAAATDTPGAISTDTPGAVSTDTPGVVPPGNETPSASETPSGSETPSASETPGGAGTLGQQVYIGQVPNANNPTNMTWVALSSSNGNQMTAFVTDGTKDHAPTFAHWYSGNLQNNKFTAQAGLPKAGKIEATITQDTATGTITLPNGKTLPFTADMLQSTSTSIGAGLYKSEQIVNGADYVVGWILAPNPSANPSATGTPGLMPSETASPSVTGTGGLMPSETATGTPGLMPSETTTGTPGLMPSETTSPSTTLSPTGSTTTTPAISGLIQAGAIYNTQTKAVSPVSELTSQDLQMKQIILPNLGSFNLLQCQNNIC